MPKRMEKGDLVASLLLDERTGGRHGFHVSYLPYPPYLGR